MLLAVLSLLAHADPVVVATRDLPVGLPLTADAVSVVEAEGPPDGFFDAAYVIGAVPAEPILAGEPIRKARLADVKSAVRLDGRVPVGLRALPLAVVAGAGGVGRGDRVDLWWRRAADAGGCRLLQSVFVQGVYFPTDKPSVLLLYLSPSDALRAEQAVALGEVYAEKRQGGATTISAEAPCPAWLPR